MTRSNGQVWLRFFALVVVVWVVLETRVMAGTVADFYPQLPPSVGSYRKAETPAIYTVETLSDYIDGGAELFISFNFDRALSVKYQKEGSDDITVDVFDMGSSADAYGVFAHSRESIDTQIGQGCEYAAGLLTFWQDRYYVSILAYPETAERREVVLALGRGIAAKIGRRGAPPAIVGLLPEQDLMPESVRYFHHHVWLNSFFYLSSDNILDIGPATSCALGRYRHQSGKYFVLLVSFPDEGKARAAVAKFSNAYLGGPQREPINVKDGGWCGYERTGRLLSAVFAAPDAETVHQALARISAVGKDKGGSK